MAEYEEIQKKYKNQITVFVWENAPFFQLKRLKNHVGHASMDIRIFEPKEAFLYISWWPSDYEGVPYYLPSCYREDLRREISSSTNEHLANREYSLRPNQVALPPKFGDKFTKNILDDDFQETAYTFSYSSGPITALKKGLTPKDIVGFQSAFIGKVNPVFGTKEDARTYLPIMDGTENFWGLNGFRMTEWWKGKKNQDEYSMFSTSSNCAGTVVKGLIAGGGEAFAPAPKRSFLMLPTNVSDWASRLEAKITFLNQTMKAALKRPVQYRERSLPVKEVDMDHGYLLNLFGGRANPFWNEFQPLFQYIQTYQLMQWNTQYVEKMKKLIMIFEKSNQLLTKHSLSPLGGRLKSIIYTIALLLGSENVMKTVSSRRQTLQSKLLAAGGEFEEVFEPMAPTDENIEKYKEHRAKRQKEARKLLKGMRKLRRL
ncbi:MAG: hypothetical protein ACLFRG_15820 [Desulfococcaceae bacterium]